MMVCILVWSLTPSCPLLCNLFGHGYRAPQGREDQTGKSSGSGITDPRSQILRSWQVCTKFCNSSLENENV